MAVTTPPNRCRLVLITPAAPDDEALAAMVARALSGGDVASLILPEHGLGEAAFQRRAEAIVPLAQARGVAAVVAGDTRIAGRVGADGIHVEAGKDALAAAVAKFQPTMMVGAGGAKSRDEALELGETRPDYLFFGRFGYDTAPEPHKRNLALGEWWAEMIEIPCIVMGGCDIASVDPVAATGAEFIALSAALFAAGADPAERVRGANARLDASAPRFAG
jgi:thiamine-phosphate pyrophosphorylase